MKRPWSVASLIRKEEREWLEINDLRRRLRYRWFEREVLRGAEQPVRYAFSLTGLLVLAILLSYILPQDWLTGYWNWGAGEKLSYFTTLWSVQATIVALVYPFAIAFVSLLLQRRPSSNAFIQIYLFYSGGLVAGLSSLFLVLCMAIQYVMLSSYSLNHMVMWGTVDAVWFAYNGILTIWFVFRTVEFLRPDFQFEIVKRYGINVALPRDIANLLRFQFFASAQKKGWIHDPEYLG